MRATSLKAYHDIVASGLLTKMRLEVFTELWKNGPLTQTQVDHNLKSDRVVNASFHKRLSELERMGTIARVGTTVDPVSGMNVYLWDVTEKMPTPLGRTPVRADARVLQTKLNLAVETLESVSQACAVCKEAIVMQHDAVRVANMLMDLIVQKTQSALVFLEVQ